MDDHCEECGYDGRRLAVSDVVQGLRPLPHEVRALVEAVDDGRLRRRPVSGWSAIEYLGHLRDLMAFHRWLIERAVAEDDPVIGAADPDAAVAGAGYADADPGALLDQFSRRVDRLCDVLAGLDDRALRRRLTVDPAAGEIDVLLVTRSALHEGRHHLMDLGRLLGPGGA